MAKESLVQRVCKEDKSLASSGIQVDLIEKLGHTVLLLGLLPSVWLKLRYAVFKSFCSFSSCVRNINKYLKLEAEGLEGFFTGQILCIVALICWYLMVAKEAKNFILRGVFADVAVATALCVFAMFAIILVTFLFLFCFPSFLFLSLV